MLDGLSGRALLDAWRAGFERIAEKTEMVDPRRRLSWVGPSMSARSSISARLMETWGARTGDLRPDGRSAPEHRPDRQHRRDGREYVRMDLLQPRTARPGATTRAAPDGAVRCALDLQRSARGQQHRGWPPSSVRSSPRCATLPTLGWWFAARPPRDGWRLRSVLRVRRMTRRHPAAACEKRSRHS